MTWRIFISAPQYHWHVTEGDTEARQHIIALAQQLHEFGQRTEAREAEMWRRLGLVATTDVMQATLAPALYRGKVGIGSNAESAGSTAGKRFGQDGYARSCLTEGWPGPPEGGTGPQTTAKWGRTADPDWAAGARFDKSTCPASAQIVASYAAEVDKKLLDMELKIRKTFNDTMEQHVEVVKAIKEEMVAVRQLQEK